MKCIALGCTSGYKSNPEKVHFFRVPKNKEKAKEWQKISRTDIIFNSSHCLCEKHFAESDIVWKKVFVNKDGEIIQEVLLKRPYVKRDVVPSLFPWVEMSNERSRLTENIENIENEILNQTDNIKDINNIQTSLHTLTFNEVKYNDKLNIPIGWNRNILSLGKISVLIFCKMMCKIIEEESHLITIKEIWVTEDMKIQVKVLGKPINLDLFGINNDLLSSIEVLEDLIKIVESYNICQAYKKEYDTDYSKVALKESKNIVRHKNCVMLLKDTNQCNFCKSLGYILDRKRKRLIETESGQKRFRIDNLSPSKKTVINDIRKQKNNLTKLKNHCAKTIEKMLGELDNMRKDISAQNRKKLEDTMANNNIPFHQQQSLREILSCSSKKSPKGRRYSDKWIFLCILFHMRSPKGYDFILNNKILPLPSPSTIRRYLSCIESCCGFDTNFFDIFRNKMQDKDEKERHGILLIDEMATRESVNVKSKTLTFSGLVDFGNDNSKGETFNDKANHGFVFMYQPLDALNAAQPISVFASKGPTEGTVLAELIVQAIVLLEKCGAKIHGVVTDGAAPNRKFWGIIGVSGKKEELKSWFAHPVDSSRKIFIFCHVADAEFYCE